MFGIGDQAGRLAAVIDSDHDDSFAGDDGAGQGFLCFGRQLVHEGVVVVRVVMEDDELLDVRRLAEPGTFGPGGMPPVYLAGEFFVGVGAVVDDQVGAFYEFQDVLVRFPGGMFGIGDQAGRLAAVIDSVTGGAVRMIEQRGAHADIPIEGEFLLQEVLIGDVRLHGLQGHREHGRGHLARQDAFNPALVVEMAGHDVQGEPGIVGELEKREAVDVIPMGVGHEQIGFLQVSAVQLVA